MPKIKIEDTDHEYSISLDNLSGAEALDIEAEKSNIQADTFEYTKQIEELDRQARILDRYDDFAQLKINPSVYEKQNEYGIPRTRANESWTNVIGNHQSSAAINFLRDRRGFGILADPVGYGKTYEAGVILSELAIRNKIKSMLFVVPNQVYSTWIKVIERLFGLGKGVLYQPSKEKKNKDAMARLDREKLQCVISRGKNMPTRPVIVKMNDFVKWSTENVDYYQYLFDAIVVDEAHHLCDENGKYAKAMCLLSKFMKTKKEASSTYCLLLTATPHSGNLAKMFNLWYFVRCEGGNPDDFTAGIGNHSERYLAEQKFYKERICNNSETIAQFINNEEQTKILDDKTYRDELLQFISESEEPLIKSLNIYSMDRFLEQPESIRVKLISSFLNQRSMKREPSEKKEEQEKFDKRKKEIIRLVRNAYRSRVLGSIMIRNTEDKVPIGRARKSVNVLFCPVENQERLNQKISWNNQLLTPSRLDEPNLIQKAYRSYSFAEYVTETISGGNRSFVDFSSALITILGVLVPPDDEEKVFPKKNSLQYYQDQISAFEDSADLDILVKPYLYTKTDNFTHKFEYTKKILAQHTGERVLVFFDYELGQMNEETVIKRFKEELRKTEFASRIIDEESIETGKWNISALQEDDENEDDEDDENDTDLVKYMIKALNCSENGILIVSSADFTEGANLQKASVLINFQVSPDPLAMDQRIGRVFRLGQENDVTIYSLANMNELEGYALMYFTRIGLMTSNSGDTTIIAGCNSENMEAIQCPSCGSVELLSHLEYLQKKQNTINAKDKRERRNTLYCENPACRGAIKGLISIYDFKCDTCKTGRMRRGKNGYECMSSNKLHIKGTLCNSGTSFSQTYYCSKKCAMKNCDFLTGKKMDCKVVEQLNKNFNTPEAMLKYICAECPHHDDGTCFPECQFDIGPDAVRACSVCNKYARCNPKPYILEFDDNWSCECPNCRKEGKEGTLKKVVARTFSAFIKSLWDFSSDNSIFCDKLLEESNKVGDIRLVLETGGKQS